MNLLIPKLPSPRDDDLSEGILDVIDTGNVYTHLGFDDTKEELDRLFSANQ